MEDKEVARRVISLLDLTSLNDDDDNTTIDNLCQRALQARVAAVCVWPRFVKFSCQQLNGSDVKVATVINFPDGGIDIGSTREEACHAIAKGADEIDLVMPYKAWLQGDYSIGQKMISEVKTVCGEAILLKVILETGRLGTQDRIAEASRDAITAGADFLKTSTGKTSISATPDAAEAILNTIRDTGRSIGFKPSGGIRTVQQAASYLYLAEHIMGTSWVQPSTFRFGASGLLDDCERCIAGLT